MSAVLEKPGIEMPYDEFNHSIPEDHFPPTGMSARAAEAMVNSQAWTDSQPVMNLSSFVTTFTEPESLKIAHDHFLKNYIDHDMYPQLFAMEGRMVRWLHQLWNGPKGVEPYGTATTHAPSCTRCETWGSSTAVTLSSNAVLPNVIPIGCLA